MSPLEVINDRPKRAGTTLTHVVMLIVGSAGLSVLAAWAWWLQRDGGRFVLAQEVGGEHLTLAELPTGLVLAVLSAAALGGVGMIWAIIGDAPLRDSLRWCGAWASRHPLLTLLLLASAALGSLDIYELVYDPFSRVQRFGAWMVRQDLRSGLQLAATLALGLAIFTWCQRSGRNVAQLIFRSPACWLLAFAAPLLLGATMSLFALEGIPHFSDSLTYLMQGRIMWSGRMVLPAPADPDLFRGSLFFVVSEGRFFGKYPLGWPIIVGTFDHFHAGLLANAVLSGCAAVLTGLLAAQFAPRRVAVLAALLFGLSPWAWFNGAHFASHVASTCAVTGFLWLFVRAMYKGSAWSAVGAGLFLAWGVLIRPGDAAVFTMPAILVVLHGMLKQPRRWFAFGPLIAAAALVGVGVYLWQNSVTTGSPTVSPYALEDRWGGDWNRSVWDLFGRFAFQWAELSQRFPGYGVSGLTVAIMGAIAAGPRWREPGLRLVAASSVLFFLFNTAFGFTTVWWGPRWLLPVVPLLCILAGELVDRMLESINNAEPHKASASCLGLSILTAGILTGLLGVYPAQFWEHRTFPPHSVSGAAHQAVLEARISNAVIAMPPTGTRPPLDARAGMVFMQAPFETNSVIYVRGIENWQAAASVTFPGRALYVLVADKNDPRGFKIKRMDQKADERP